MNKPIDGNSLDMARRLLDVGILVAAAEIVSEAYFNMPLNTLRPMHAIIVSACSLICFFTFSKFDLYCSWRGRSMLAMCSRLAVSWIFILGAGLLFSFALQRSSELSRLWIIYWFWTSLILLIVHRLVAYYVLHFVRRKYGFNLKNVLIVGYGQNGMAMHRKAIEQDWFGYEVKAIYAEAEELTRIDDKNLARLSKIEDIPDYVEKHHINEIWITLPLSESEKLQKLEYWLRNTLVNIRLIPDTVGIRILSNKLANFMGTPAIDLNRPSSTGLDGIVKELFDKAFALIVLIALAVPFAVLAIIIKCTSPGPVFYKQSRHGLNGKKFLIYKFRTMEAHQELNPDTITQATKNDSRITPIGRFIRRTSIDELPQFINVLKGDMSIVGPRPHAVQHNELYEDLLDVYMLRHRVKPGITGWAQIHGLRGETDTVDKMKKRVQFDLQYIQNWSLWLDIRIITWTAIKGWTGKNAY